MEYKTQPNSTHHNKKDSRSRKCSRWADHLVNKPTLGERDLGVSRAKYAEIKEVAE